MAREERTGTAVVGHFDFDWLRKLENHAAAAALNYFAYNFIKIHRTLPTSHPPRTAAR